VRHAKAYGASRAGSTRRDNKRIHCPRASSRRRRRHPAQFDSPCRGAHRTRPRIDWKRTCFDRWPPRRSTRTPRRSSDRPRCIRRSRRTGTCTRRTRCRQCTRRRWGPHPPSLPPAGTRRLRAKVRPPLPIRLRPPSRPLARIRLFPRIRPRVPTRPLARVRPFARKHLEEPSAPGSDLPRCTP
jgi:hypothetical protein